MLVFIGITGLLIPMLVMMIAPISLVLATAHVINKLSSDSEIIVMNAAGVSPWSLFRPFQREALQVVFRIPYGETCTYHDIAIEIGRPNASRAVGRANATNPMPIVIPCHRVIGRDGKLHGYGGGEGLKTKEWLLQMEGAVIA